jgi:serine/threonine-protein kinase ULK/ATG1
MHRDLKLANILKNNGYLKIADFGFAKIVVNGPNSLRTQCGTPVSFFFRRVEKCVFLKDEQ